MKIVVTGGSGFLGAATVKYARETGHEVWTFDHADGHDILGDLDGLKDADHVIHLAGLLGTHELFEDVERAVDVNVHGTRRVLDWCRANHAGYTGITMPDAFPSIYTATKLAPDRLATAYHHAFGVPVSRVRAFNAHGPGQKHGPGHPQKILPTFATEAWAGRPLPVWGAGTQTVDLVTADDLGRMLVDATAYGDDDVFDGGTGKAQSVMTVARYVIRRVTAKGGPSAKIVHKPMRRGETPTDIVARGVGWERLGWKPFFSWDDVAKTVDSYRPGAIEQCDHVWRPDELGVQTCMRCGERE